MVSPAAGEVVLVPFPFSNLSQSKVRPAVCLAAAFPATGHAAGTGFVGSGLAVTRNAGGGLELISKPGSGTEVHAWFPLKWQNSENSAPAWDEEDFQKSLNT